ncbi:MAG: sensor histidine kinase [Phycisphaerales bacterium]|jgi:C4-dicarboxylate-specific signal transduction histidine kinase
MLLESNTAAGSREPMTDAMEHHRDNDPSSRRTGRPAPGVPGMVPVADRLTSLAHDLNNLLDGSMRQLALARQSLDADLSAAAAGQLEGVRDHVNTAYQAMERMCDLLHASLSGAPGGPASPTVARGRPISLAEAAEHALAVVRPMAEEALARLDSSLDPSTFEFAAGAVYPLILNGLRNAIEAVERTGRPGEVSLVLTVEHDEEAGPVIVLEIRDTGPGLDSTASPARLFEPGVTSKAKGFGLGLAICAEVARDMGGSIEIAPRREGGAVLRARYPVPQDRGAESIG